MSRNGDELQSLLQDASGPIVVSRAISPELRAGLGSSGRDDVIVRPTVRGSTVWGDASDAVVIIEQPNWFGRPELLPTARVVILVDETATACFDTSAGHHFVRDSATNGIVVCGSLRSEEAVAGRRQSHSMATTQARRLALLGGQVPGFRLAHGKPRSPVFVAMFPLDPHRVTSALAGSVGVSAAPAGPRFPDLPGGVRIRVDAAASEEGLRDWIGAADEIVRSGERLES